METDVENSFLEIRSALVTGRFDELPKLVEMQKRLIGALERGQISGCSNPAFLRRLKTLSDANLRLTRAALEGLLQARETGFSAENIRSYGPKGEPRVLGTWR